MRFILWITLKVLTTMENNVMKEGKSTILKYGNKVYVYIPYSISIDSAFPFKKGDRVTIKIVDDKVIIEKEQ